MKVILPTSSFPPLSYFQLLLKADEVYIEIHETFPKQTIRNRYEILTSQGRHPLSIPLEGRSNSSKTNEIRISSDAKWKTQHWRTIITAYSSSPYFIHYADKIEALIFSDKSQLVDFNTNGLKEFLRIIKAEKQILFTEVYQKDVPAEEDKRNYPPAIEQQRYMQVFEDRTGFQKDLSILDLIFNLGPGSLNYLLQ